MKTRIIIPLVATSLVLGGSAAHAQLTITPTFGSSITSSPFAAVIENSINTDISTLESDVTTLRPDTVAIDFQSVNSGLGGSSTGIALVPYSTYLSGLEANPSKSANQISALANMPAGPATGINNNSSSVMMTAADLAAIGQTSIAAAVVTANGGFNGTISLNTGIMNLSRPDANPSL